MVETIKLVRLRGTLKFYEHLKHYLKFLNDFGYDSIKGTNTNWKAFKLRLVGLGVDGWDLGDIKSVLRKLDIIKIAN